MNKGEKSRSAPRTEPLQAFQRWEGRRRKEGGGEKEVEMGRKGETTVGKGKESFFEGQMLLWCSCICLYVSACPIVKEKNHLAKRG